MSKTGNLFILDLHDSLRRVGFEIPDDHGPRLRLRVRDSTMLIRLPGFGISSCSIV